jgi:hypothetical protein
MEDNCFVTLQLSVLNLSCLQNDRENGCQHQQPRRRGQLRRGQETPPVRGRPVR